jgi:sugar fermentation stimulation protein A
VRVNGTWVGINTMVPNRLVYQTLCECQLDYFNDYTTVRREVKWGAHSRIDLLLTGGRQSCYIEVKNVTLAQARVAYFPDAVTERGQKHLRDLQEIVQQGHRGVILFLVQRMDVERFMPARFIDPEYGRLLTAAKEQGVEILVCQAQVTPEEITLVRTLDYSLGRR